jgi:hypothetical protein
LTHFREEKSHKLTLNTLIDAIFLRQKVVFVTMQAGVDEWTTHVCRPIIKPASELKLSVTGDVL